LVFILIYTRFYNISWGLPYPFHPDERNIAVSLEQLSCSVSNIKECLNPHFFAYGQFFIYLSFFIYKLFLFITSGSFLGKISFFDSFLILRIISALSSVITVIFSLLIIKEFIYKKARPQINNIILGGFLLLIFSPGLIQFAHFGTTESLLIMFYTILVYFAALLINKKISIQKYVFSTALTIGLAAATKISSLVFSIAPVLILLTYKKLDKKTILYLFEFLFVILFFTVIFSPYNLIAFKDFIGALRYESDVASGAAKVFYTYQFEYTIPIFFQLFNIFPFVLGIPILILFLSWILFLRLNKTNNILRIFFLSYFIPTAFLYSKWTRFVVPILPICIIIGLLFLIEYKNLFFKKTKIQNILFWTIILISIIPGIAFLSIYSNDDIRNQASKWINKNIPSKTLILSETANVVDIPNYFAKNNSYKVISFDFYGLDNNDELKNKLTEYVSSADYIFVPSRRIFANYTCEKDKKITNNIPVFRNTTISDSKKCEQLKEKYPLLNEYYEMLFSEKKFKKVAELSSYPTIELFGKKVIEIKDEMAEETFTVFDHPVIRIYKRI